MGYQWPHKKIYMSIKNLKKNKTQQVCARQRDDFQFFPRLWSWNLSHIPFHCFLSFSSQFCNQECQIILLICPYKVILTEPKTSSMNPLPLIWQCSFHPRRTYKFKTIFLWPRLESQYHHHHGFCSTIVVKGRGGGRFGMAECYQFLLIQVAMKVSHVKRCLIDTNVNKNAFQWDAYRPLVDRIPACTWQEGGDGVCVS